MAVALLAVASLLVAACTGSDDDADTPAATEGTVGSLPDGMVEVMDRDPYGHARWGVLVEPLDEGEPVVSRGAEELFGMGSNTKLYTVGTYLDAVGADHRITTPVHQQGDDLVLVGMGDLVMGGRDAGADQLGYSIPPQPDAGLLPGTKPAPGDPLAGLDDLAGQVAAAGVTEVPGDVVVDDRLFEPWSTQGATISPIVVNDNLVAVEATPAEEGQPPTLRVVPETAAFTVENRATTGAAGGDTTVALAPAETDVEGDPEGSTLVLSGEVPADAEPFLTVFDVPDPASFARTLFIEALQRAGVAVAADPTAGNDTGDLAPFGSEPGDPVATLTGPTSAQVATLIWKISFNVGANLLTCLLAVEGGSTECTDGLAAVHDRLGDIDVADEEVWMLNGAGAEFSSTTPEAMVAWLRWMRDQDWGEDLEQMLPIMGVDGSLGLSQQDTPSTGRIQAKTGTWAGGDPGTGDLLLPGLGLAGFMQGPDGRDHVFAVYMNGATFPGDPGEAVLRSTFDMSDVAAALQQALPEA
ncbi:D-alanyl-D-alanine carboxypeptidase [Iamia majanohamensis]|uniref:D-alanyl-D-alanine carboxypeptidase n=1 Tax=Iamia majanohamensis TaxID=467976 RepID=A0AAF0BTD6_9ACTN|nr:D-alanyl-D-alanine carboxypeptidase [Iamia majanohamensis]WCO66637.1 D-alanyl-D-alanine carboxypeptidase [Iamia majanohamensis]